MKALLCKSFGPPESLVLEDVPSPEAGPGKVVVSVRGCSLNFPDLLVIQDKYQYKPPLPFSPGAEISGVVKSVGPGVTGCKAGDRVISGDDERVEPRAGNCMPLRRVPLGMSVHNIELTPGRGGQICRSAGCTATLTAREADWAQVTLPSGEIRRVSSKCRATLGTVSNAEHMNVSLGKAGRKRWMGRKPHNRGMAMNPTDHPMGGGEGRSKSGGHPCGPSGVLSKGGKTRHKRKPSSKAIVRRRPAGSHQTGVS